MFFLTPRYLKNAKLLHKGLTRFIHYKRDILAPARLEEIEGLRRSLESATKARDKAQIEALSEQINDTCQKALPSDGRDDLSDNIEVFFVAIVIALAIRAFIAQPFQIPTGSMQPTLYGITAEATEHDPRPNLLVRAFDLLRGQSYVNVVSNHEGFLAKVSSSKSTSTWRGLVSGQDPNSVEEDFLTEHRLVIFTYCKLHFEDGHTMWIWAPKRQLKAELGLIHHLNIPTRIAKDANGNEILTPDAQTIREADTSRIFVSKGQLLARGILKTGDSILVNKFAYHFRRPERGEVWVFTTKHITGIEKNSGSFDPRHGSQHYIKRLVGVPGDHVQVRPPELWINGQPAKEDGMKRVASQKDDYPGYSLIPPSYQFPEVWNDVQLKPGQYMACGDNSANSLDSRYWGPVPERNVVGPALFAYWPFTSRWGPIR